MVESYLHFLVVPLIWHELTVFDESKGEDKVVGQRDVDVFRKEGTSCWSVLGPVRVVTHALVLGCMANCFNSLHRVM